MPRLQPRSWACPCNACARFCAKRVHTFGVPSGGRGEMTKRFQKELELYLIGEHDEPADVEASLASDESSLAFLASEAQFETLLRDAAAAATFCPGCKDLVLTDR